MDEITNFGRDPTLKLSSTWLSLETWQSSDPGEMWERREGGRGGWQLSPRHTTSVSHYHLSPSFITDLSCQYRARSWSTQYSCKSWLLAVRIVSRLVMGTNYVWHLEYHKYLNRLHPQISVQGGLITREVHCLTDWFVFMSDKSCCWKCNNPS